MMPTAMSLLTHMGTIDDNEGMLLLFLSMWLFVMQRELVLEGIEGSRRITAETKIMKIWEILQSLDNWL